MRTSFSFCPPHLFHQQTSICFHLDYHEEGWAPKNWCFRTVVLEKALENPLYCKIKPVNPKGKDWCWSWSSSTLAIWHEEPTHWKRPWCWEWLRAEGEGATDEETVGWHHRFNGYEFEQTPGDSEGQESLACCNPGVTKSWIQLNDWTTISTLSYNLYTIKLSHLKYSSQWFLVIKES